MTFIITPPQKKINPKNKTKNNKNNQTETSYRLNTTHTSNKT